ncbi:MAG: hypothetical protein WCJ42_12050 [Actinomycetes bacterium]
MQLSGHEDFTGVVRAKSVSADYFHALGDKRHVWAAPVLYGDLWQNMPTPTSQIARPG